MGYTALKPEQIPASSKVRNLSYAQEAIAFIREDCEKLKFDSKKEDEASSKKYTGRSKGKDLIPYNMERDLDRLCLENAIARFVESGTRMDAFDVYYCYCEIFKPFGDDSENARKLLDLLSDHESNASSLLEKHRDHYSHSVYVFLTGLAIYRRHDKLRQKYNERYPGMNDREAAHHFLEHWGLTALFHDIGYPFQIAFDQIKDYIKKIDPDNKDTFAAYRGIEQFYTSNGVNLDNELWELIQDRFDGYIRLSTSKIRKCNGEGLYKTHASGEEADKNEKRFLDHAYFSAVLLARNFVNNEKDFFNSGSNQTRCDCLCAIAVHNSLFKYEIIKTNGSPLSLDYDMPLTYLLMLCDELQSWNRASYGAQSRKKTYPIDFDMRFSDGAIKQVCYYYNAAFHQEAEHSADWDEKKYYTKKGFLKSNSDFLDDIHAFLDLSDAFANAFTKYESGVKEGDIIRLETKVMDMRALSNLSIGNYLNLYNLAVGLHNGYEKVRTNGLGKLYSDFEKGLSLEYKLSNIGQAKGFADCLYIIGCFYTDRMMDLEVVTHFTKNELRKLAEAEHERWCREKIAMGWTPYYGAGKLDSSSRELLRQQPSLTHYSLLPAEFQEYTINAMNTMLKLLKEEEGLLVYRF